MLNTSARPSATPRTVLVVEDEPTLATAIAQRITAEGWTARVASDGASAVQAATQLRPDLVIMDIMLPVMDGLEATKRIVAERPVPVLILTARDDEADKVIGLGAGADDYMTKPFNILEVRARISTVLRRAGGHVVQEQKIIRVHDMEVNLVKRTVTLGGEEVRLTAKEFDLLQMFITNRGRPFSRKEMLEAVWKYDDYTGDARTVDVHIRRLREKIERNPDEPEFIFTKWKVGYYFTDKD